MTTPPTPSRQSPIFLAGISIALTAVNLRTAITGFSPLLQTIGADLGFGVAVIGVLGAAPPAVFGVVGLLAPRLARRSGPERTAAAAMALTAASLLLRALSPEPAVLVASTALALAGIGAANVLVVPLVKTWFPHHVVGGTTAYLMLMQAGQFLAPLLAVPVAEAAGWRLSVGVWMVPAALAAAAWWAVAATTTTTTPTAPTPAGRQAAASPTALATGPVSITRSRTVWGLVVLFALMSLSNYAIVTWLPSVLSDAGASEVLGGSMVALYSVWGVAAALVVPRLAARMDNPFITVVVSSACLVAGCLGLLVAPLDAAAAWACLLGVGVSTFPLCLILINQRTRSAQTASAVSGLVQGLGYALACVGPIGLGLLRAATGSWSVPLWVMAATAVPTLVAGWYACRPGFVEDDLTAPSASAAPDQHRHDQRRPGTPEHPTTARRDHRNHRATSGSSVLRAAGHLLLTTCRPLVDHSWTTRGSPTHHLLELFTMTTPTPAATGPAAALVTGPRRHDPRLVLTLLTVVIFTTITYELLPVGLLPQIATALDSTPQGAGLLIGAYSVVVTLTSIPLSAMTARFDVKATLVVLLALLALSTALLAVAPFLAVALAARLVGGLAHAIIWTSVFRLAVDAVPAHRRGRAAAALSAGNAIALTAGVPLATAFGSATTWRLPFAALGAAFVVMAALVVWVVPRGLGEADSAMTTRAVLGAATRAPLLKVGVTVAALTTANFTTYTYLAPLLATAGVRDGALSWVLTGYGLAGLVGLVAVTRASDTRPGPALAATLSLMALSLVALGLALPTAGTTSAAVLMWGVGAGAFPVLLQVLALRAAGPLTAAAPALVNSTFNIGITAGSAIGGQVLTTTGANPLPMISAALLAVVVVLTLSPRWLPASTAGARP